MNTPAEIARLRGELKQHPRDEAIAADYLKIVVDSADKRMALGEARQVRLAFPNSERIAFDFSRTCAENGLFEEARQTLLTLPSPRQDGFVEYVVGVYFYQEKRYDEAETSLRKALVLRPLDVPTWLALISVHIDKGEFEVAEALLTEAEAVCPDSHLLLQIRSKVLRARGDLDAALDFTRTALQLVPEDEWFLDFYITLLSDTGRSDEYLAELQRAFEQNPLNKRFTVLLVQELKRRRQFMASVRVIREHGRATRNLLKG